MSKAIFLGSFNPPHKGHYNVIKSFIDSGFMKTYGIDKIHIIPCYQNPNKLNFETNYGISFNDRYKMCLRMFSDLINDNKVFIDSIENIIKPNYTYELIEYFKSNKDYIINDDFYWIITTETYNEIFKGNWKNSEWLLENNRFVLIYEDNGQIPICDINVYPIPLKENINIHSTQIREKIKNGESVVNETNIYVQDLINNENLYKLI